MRITFLRMFIVVLAAFAALCLSFGHDDLREFDAAYIHQEILRDAAESPAAQRVPQNLLFSRSTAVKRGYSVRAAVISSPTLSAVSTCILRC